MTEKYRVKVGNDNFKPWDKWSREDLEYSAQELGFPRGFIEELSDKTLFDKIISEKCRQSNKEK